MSVEIEYVRLDEYFVTLVTDPVTSHEDIKLEYTIAKAPRDKPTLKWIPQDITVLTIHNLHPEVSELDLLHLFEKVGDLLYSAVRAVTPTVRMGFFVFRNMEAGRKALKLLKKSKYVHLPLTKLLHKLVFDLEIPSNLLKTLALCYHYDNYEIYKCYNSFSEVCVLIENFKYTLRYYYYEFLP